MKPFLLLCGCAVWLWPAVGAAAAEKPFATTAQFEFYNHYWTNVHHFLYHQAQKEAEASVLDSLEQAVIAKLNTEERAIYKQAVDFYKKYLATRSLLRDEVMRNIRTCLIQYRENEVPSCETLEQEHIELFKTFGKVYKKHFWKLHEAHNARQFNQHLPMLKQLEAEVLQRIATLGNTSWGKDKIRVDLSAYASRSGAYNLPDPTIIVLATANHRLPGTQWLEMLFHEAAHSIIKAETGALSLQITRASDTLGKQPPYDFWHIVLFYIAGKATQEALAKRGIEHTLYMETQGIARRYYSVLSENMDVYLEGRISLYEALRRTIDRV
ncbi:MAG TPA: hypothetical protein PKC76_08170 [Saprospiraceae bacterium]|nr:hypothetical protein [Saprospiraceae bacterium]HMP24091.1 hypothetical protein [Saprospiraceae bacterium]